MKSIAFGRPRPSIGMVVKTREGKTYNLGIQKDGKITKHTSKFTQTLRIMYYRWHRGRTLKGKEKIEFKEQIKQLRKKL